MMSKPTTSARSLVNSRQIASTSLHVQQPLTFRLYIWPFAVLYWCWFAAWFYLTRLNPQALRNFLQSSQLVDPQSLFGRYPFLTLGFWIKYEEFMLIPLCFLLFVHFITRMSCLWNVSANAFLSCKRVAKVREAEMILVNPIAHRGKPELCRLKRKDDGVIFFEYQQRKFYWNEDKQLFLKVFYPDALCMREYQESAGLSAPAATELLEKFGRNAFDLPVPTFTSLFKEHAVAPFFVFQMFCVGLWCLD